MRVTPSAPAVATRRPQAQPRWRALPAVPDGGQARRAIRAGRVGLAGPASARGAVSGSSGESSRWRWRSRRHVILRVYVRMAW